MPHDLRPTILLVDDNPQIRSFIKPTLEDNGFKCIEAANGDEAVYQAQESHPDLILLDIELGDPAMDGLDTCKRIRALGLTTPVIFFDTAGHCGRPGVWSGPSRTGLRLREKARRVAQHAGGR